MFLKGTLRWLRSTDGYLHEAADAGAGSGGAAGTGAPDAAAAAGAASGSTGSASAAGSAGAASGNGAAAGERHYTKAEYDAALKAAEQTARRGWMPAHRLSEETKPLTGKIAELENRIRALVGIETKSPSQREAEEVHDGFAKMFPHLGKLTPDLVGRLERLVTMSDDLVASSEHQWNSLATDTLRSLDSKILERIGADELTDGQRATIHAAFTASAGRDPEKLARFKQRYEARDATLVDEFVEDFAKNFIEPAKRLALAPVVSARPVPRFGSSRPVVSSTPKHKATGDLDKAMDAAISAIAERDPQFKRSAAR